MHMKGSLGSAGDVERNSRICPGVSVARKKELPEAVILLLGSDSLEPDQAHDNLQIALYRARLQHCLCSFLQRAGATSSVGRTA